MPAKKSKSKKGPLTHKEIEKLTVVKLRAELKRQGLDTSGLKAVLVSRLKEWTDTQAGPEQQWGQEGADKEERDTYGDSLVNFKRNKARSSGFKFSLNEVIWTRNVPKLIESKNPKIVLSSSCPRRQMVKIPFEGSSISQEI